MALENTYPIFSSDVWSMIFNSINDAISITTKEGNILFCNKAMEKLVRRPYLAIIDECCNTLLSQFSHPVELCPRRLVLTSKKRESLILNAGTTLLTCIVDPILDKNNEIANLILIITSAAA